MRSVAKEAGLSHSPLSRGYYPKVCAAIKLARPTRTVSTAGKDIRLLDLKRLLDEANDAKRKMATQLAYLTLRCSELERKLNRKSPSLPGPSDGTIL